MFKSFALTVALGTAGAIACTIIPSYVRFDTVSAGVVAVTKARYSVMTNDTVSNQRDTIKVSRVQDMKAHYQGYFRDSSLVFIARIDTGFYIAENADTSGIVPARVLSTPFDTVSGIARMYMKFSIDTVFRGSLPGKAFWVRAKAATPLCGFSPLQLKGQTFINASSGFTKFTDLKAPINEGISNIAYGTGFPLAELFDGRYFLSPEFPGLRLDITELYPDYPATSIAARRAPDGVLRPDGKSYRPDGRIAPSDEASRRKTPVPLLK